MSRWIAVVLILSVAGCQRQEELDAEIADLEKQAAEQSKQIAATQEQLWLSEARLDAVRAENTLLESPANRWNQDSGEAGQGRDRDAEDLAFKELAKAWEARKATLSRQTFVEGTGTLRDHAVELPKTTRAAVEHYPSRVSEAESAHRTRLEDSEWQSRSPLWATARALISSDFLLVWASCLTGLLVVWAVARHDFRHPIRAERRAIVNEAWLGITARYRAFLKLLSVNRLLAAAAVSLLIIVASLHSLRPGVQELLQRKRDRLKALVGSQAKEIAELKGRHVAVSEQLDASAKKNEELFPAYIRGLTGHFVGQGEDAMHASLAASHRSTGDQIRQYSASVGIANRASHELSSHADLVATQDAALVGFEDKARSHQFNLLVSKGAVSMILLGLNLALIFSWRRKRHRVDRAISEVCPRCLTEKEPKVVPSSNWGPLVECSEDMCKYQMKVRHRNTIRLRLPLVGHTEAGKTVWLAMFHWLTKGKAKGEGRIRADTKLVKFDRATSPSSEDDKYDAILRRLVEERRKIARTAFEAGRLRDPLLFDFSDGDAFFAPSNGVVNVFDLAGAISSPFLRGSDAQDRAYRATDGFLYFIDPTRADEKYLAVR